MIAQGLEGGDVSTEAVKYQVECWCKALKNRFCSMIIRGYKKYQDSQLSPTTVYDSCMDVHWRP